MTTFPLDFVEAFHFSMNYEVGPQYNKDDVETIAGKCDTKAQRRKTGYVNNANDKGGETKFGVAKKSHPNINIKALTLNGAMQIFYNEYWLAGDCDKLKAPLSIAHFDACVNHYINRAAKFLQEAVGVDIDGILGRHSIAAINEGDPIELTQKQIKIRERFFRTLAKNNPSQEEFLDGWLARVESIEETLA